MSDIAAQPSSNESHQSTRNTPLSDEWITKLAVELSSGGFGRTDGVIDEMWSCSFEHPDLLQFARAIEAAAIRNVTAAGFAGSSDRKALDDAAT